MPRRGQAGLQRGDRLKACAEDEVPIRESETSGRVKHAERLQAG